MVDFLGIFGKLINWLFTLGGLLKKPRPMIKVNSRRYYKLEFINQGTISQTIEEIGLIFRRNKKIVLRSDLTRILLPNDTKNESFDIDAFKNKIQEKNIEMPLKCRQYVKTTDGKTFKSKKLVITESSLDEREPRPAVFF